MPSSNTLSVANEPKAEGNIRLAATVLFYILQKNSIKKEPDIYSKSTSCDLS
jgi:hypothetical protein